MKTANLLIAQLVERCQVNLNVAVSDPAVDHFSLFYLNLFDSPALVLLTLLMQLLHLSFMISLVLVALVSG